MKIGLLQNFGLMLINQTKNVGIKSLLDTLSYKKIDSVAIGFGVGPRINACGRIADPKVALNLLTTRNQEEAKEIAKELNETNEKRQAIEKNILEEVVNKIEESKMENSNVIVVANENWHHGVIGIVASKITEKYFKPSIILRNRRRYC